MLNYIVNDQAIVFFFDGKPLKVKRTDAQYFQAIKIFDLPESDQEEALKKIFEEKPDKFKEKGFVISSEEVFYKGDLIPEPLASKVRKMALEGLPIELFSKFWKNLKKNPSANSVRQLYSFLSYRELPITDDGCFLAYKGIREDGKSVQGNLDTKVKKGEVDSCGRISNGIGDVIEVERYDVDDNPDVHCSFGLHVGSLDYASSWASKVVVVKVNPKNVVSVPTDCGFQKCRVSKYKVVDSFENEIEYDLVDEDGEPIESEVKQEECKVAKRVMNYVNNKIKKGVKEIDIRKIQNALSPDYIGKVRALSILISLGLPWKLTKDGKHVVSLDRI